MIDTARRLRPGIAIGADLIAGFPTETDALFQQTLDFVTAQELPYLHVFPYSERPGTPAARMPPVPPPARRERAARLREAGRRMAQHFHAAQIGAKPRSSPKLPRPATPSILPPCALPTPCRPPRCCAPG